MSSSSQGNRAALVGEIARELRQFNGLGASFFRAAAARVGMTATDMQVIDLLESTDSMTAGQLADLTGLTTGAITGMLNRLEEAGLVRRERDPNDGRRVIVRLISGRDEMRKIASTFDSLGKSWGEMASDYNDEQLTLLLTFLKRNNEISRREIVRLREAPESEGRTYSTSLGDVESGQLLIPNGIIGLTLRTDENMAELYQARFEGPAPDVKVRDGVVTVRYSKYLGMMNWRKRAAEITLNIAIPWRIVIKGGASDVTAELGRLNLAGLEIKGGLSAIRLELPAPIGEVPIRISGGASEVTVHRPAGIAARVHLKGWASTFVFDDQTFGYMGNDIQLQTPNYEMSTRRYDIDISSSVSMVTITSG